MYRIIPLRILRRTRGVMFDEMVPSDIPKISGIDRVIHGPNSISPGPIEDSPIPVKRPWYMHPGQDDNLLVLQGSRYIDIFDIINVRLREDIVFSQMLSAVVESFSNKIYLAASEERNRREYKEYQQTNGWVEEDVKELNDENFD